MRIHTELLLTTLLFTLLPIESIQFYNGPNDIANPFGPNMEKYNSQAFNLIDLLNKVNANNSDSVKANQAGNQQLQNFQKDFRTYVKSKNNLFNYSNWSDRKPLANVVNLNSGQPDRSSSFNDRFSNIQRPNFDGDQVAINSFIRYSDLKRIIKIVVSYIRRLCRGSIALIMRIIHLMKINLGLFAVVTKSVVKIL